jgi:hypothetical protein
MMPRRKGLFITTILLRKLDKATFIKSIMEILAEYLSAMDM